MKEIINLTPHNVSVLTEGKIINFPSMGNARLKTNTMVVGVIENIPITKTEFGKVEGLPSFQEDKFYIVSQLIKNALPERKDLLVPSEPIRNEDGVVIACKSLGI